MRYKIHLILGIACMLFITSCSKDDFLDFLIGPQPKFIDNNQFIPGFNILGVIRPDSVGNQTMSMVHVEKVLPAITSENDSKEVADARVMIYHTLDNQIDDSTQFDYVRNDDSYATYKPLVFRPKAGDHYKIKCTNPKLPTLTAETIVPDIPSIVDDNVTVNGNTITLSILHNSSASMYDIYLYTADKIIPNRIMQSENGDTQVAINNIGSITPDAKLVIYAYDKNLTEYLTASNVFIKPNTYRPPFTNVTNGYGCFGSMNLLVRKL